MDDRTSHCHDEQPRPPLHMFHDLFDWFRRMRRTQVWQGVVSQGEGPDRSRPDGSMMCSATLLWHRSVRHGVALRGRRTAGVKARKALIDGRRTAGVRARRAPHFFSFFVAGTRDLICFPTSSRSTMPDATFCWTSFAIGMVNASPGFLFVESARA